MRVLLVSNASPFEKVKTGYAVQLRYLTCMFLNRGHSVTHVTWNMHIGGGRQMTFREVAEYPEFRDYTTDPYSRSLLDNPGVHMMFNPHIDLRNEIKCSEINQMIHLTNSDHVFFIMDPHVISFTDANKFACRSHFWLPIHYDPIEKYTEYVLKHFDHIIPLSPSTEKLVIKQIGRSERCIPHVINFRTPLPEQITKDHLRNEFGISSTKWLILTVAGNYEMTGRKSLDTTIVSFKKILEKHENAVLWIHAQYEDTGSKKAYDIRGMAMDLKIPFDSLIITESVVDETVLQKMYKCADVYLCGSKAEGFGIPQLEAQYFGVPVVATKFGAMEDYCWHGICAEPAQVSYNHMQSAWWVMPSINNMVEALDKVYKGELTTTSEEVSERVRNEMSYDTVAKKIIDHLENSF